jgi:hypothetical protein
VFTANVFGNSAINVFFVSLVATFLILLNLGQGGVYDKNVLTALELSYIVNLALLAASAALARQVYGKSGRPAIYTSCAVAMVTFIGTLVYHMKVQVMRWYCQSKYGENAMEISFQRDYKRLDDSISGGGWSPRPHVATTVIEISRDDH